MKTVVRTLRWMLSGIRGCFSVLQRCGTALSGRRGALVVSENPLSVQDRGDMLRRVMFYAPRLARELVFAPVASLGDVFSTRTLLFRGGTGRWLARVLLRLRPDTYDVDPLTNPLEGSEWCRINFSESAKPLHEASLERLISYVQELQKHALAKAYVFGTGPSLERALNLDWSDGYRIVCNTIVRDRQLWMHIQPHFIVAADAIYHFGFTEFASRFRADLYERMLESTALFLYPEIFHGIVVREFSVFADRLIPVPQGVHHDFRLSLMERFSLPNLGNVLNLVLLPLACTLSKTVCLWGFDGRAPTDQLFWANSSKHSYPELMDVLRAAHPGFFEHHVPAGKPVTYVKKFHGDELDRCLTDAETRGWRFMMMHKSWTATLQKRFWPQ